jgi:anaerobic magnesium-protoporphyrin IX monomethyl ester cyclase
MKKDELKIVIITTPIRPIPTSYPPIGALSVISSLKEAGYSSTKFYDVDGLRPSYEEALNHLINLKPDIVGISAVVSTAYEYTKRISLNIKEHLPNTTIILGGNLGASAEILLKYTGVDFVSLGEGNNVIVEFMDTYISENANKSYVNVPSLVFLDKNQNLINTGYAKQISKEKIYDIDWKILEEHSKIENFFIPATESKLAQSSFSHDKRTKEEHRQNKTIGTLVASKGCVARCTFCHRWDKGIRYIPIPILKERIQEFIEKYNVGFISFGDENFGSSHVWLSEFCEMIKPFDVLWRVSGMRVNRVDPKHLFMMKDAGCSAVYFGMETGSEKMLQIMEKKVKLEDNYNAMKWIVEAGLNTTVQLVVGMPGEDNSTIRNTGKFVGFASQLSKDNNPLNLSINYAQALPGTPLYEYGRKKGLIGTDSFSEEEYLLMISDRDAADEATTINFSDSPRINIQAWRPYLIAIAARSYIKKFGRKNYIKQIQKSHYFEVLKDKDIHLSKETGYFNFPKEKIDLRGSTDSTNESWRPMVMKENQLPSFWKIISQKQWRVLFIVYPMTIYHFRFFLPMLVLFYAFFRQGASSARSLFKEYLLWWFKRILFLSRSKENLEIKSLRKIVKDDFRQIPTDLNAMEPLRQGR